MPHTVKALLLSDSLRTSTLHHTASLLARVNEAIEMVQVFLEDVFDSLQLIEGAIWTCQCLDVGNVAGSSHLRVLSQVERRVLLEAGIPLHLHVVDRGTLVGSNSYLLGLLLRRRNSLHLL